MLEIIKSWFTKNDVKNVSLDDTIKTVNLQEKMVNSSIVNMPSKPLDPSILDITEPSHKTWNPRVFAIYVTKFDPADKSVFDKVEYPQYGDMVVVKYNNDSVMAMYMYKRNGWEEI